MEPTQLAAFHQWLFDPNSDDDHYGIFEQDDLVRAIQVVVFDWEHHAKSMSHDHQNKVIWRIIGNPLFFFMDTLDGPSIDVMGSFLKAAKNLTLAIPRLFEEGEPMENGYFMWWDSLVSDQTDAEILEVCLEILADLSRHEDMRVAWAALHGLGHLNHPKRVAVVDEFIKRVPEAATHEWVLSCRDGTVM